MSRLRPALVLALVTACGSSHAPAPGSGDGGSGPAPVTLATCPTTGKGALVPLAGSACYALTPAETGADATGQNATEASYAVTAASGVTPRDRLVLFMNGSGGHPRGPIATPSVNFYNAAASLGYDVLAISYYSAATVGGMCRTNAGCYYPTRESIILGVAQSGAASGVSGIRLDEGIVDRAVLALRTLAAGNPQGRWKDYLTSASATSAPEGQIDWSRVVTAGHSQGAGHAAAMGKLFPVARVIQLSGTCDGAHRQPAPWTSGSTGTWASDPSQFWGLDVATRFDASGQPSGGDTICAYHLVDWQSLGMVASHQIDDAATCGATTAQELHGASVKCADNKATWVKMLE